jgi:protein gp37
MPSKIEWLRGSDAMAAGETWNPIRSRRKSDGKVGWHCVRISPGCVHCYSATQNQRCGTNRGRNGTGLDYTVPGLEQVEIFLDEKTLLQPLHWKKGRLIFPCSMTDWQADFVPDEFRDKMLAVMALTPQHTYLTLTKRADRQRKYLNDGALRLRIAREANVMMRSDKGAANSEALASVFTWRAFEYAEVGEYANYLAGITDRCWPLPNLWLGTSAENQEYADKRIPELLQTPAAVRWVSAEPLLGPIDFHGILHPENFVLAGVPVGWINWVVCGGESGPGARPMHPEWARSIRDQCAAADVPFFFKQVGEWVWSGLHNANTIINTVGGKIVIAYNQRLIPGKCGKTLVTRVGKKAAGRLLDGREHNEYPEVK